MSWKLIKMFSLHACSCVMTICAVSSAVFSGKLGCTLDRQLGGFGIHAGVFFLQSASSLNPRVHRNPHSSSLLLWSSQYAVSQVESSPVQSPVNTPLILKITNVAGCRHAKTAELVKDCQLGEARANTGHGVDKAPKQLEGSIEAEMCYGRW